MTMFHPFFLPISLFFIGLLSPVYSIYLEQNHADFVDHSIIESIEASCQLLEEANSMSLLKKHFNMSALKEVMHFRTRTGSTLWDVIKSGVQNLDSSIGVYAPDAEAYTLYKKLLDPIIEDYHGFGPADKQPPVDLGESKIDQLSDLDPAGKYIKSTRIRCARSLEGFPFNPRLTRNEYIDIEERVKSALSQIDEVDLTGTYYSLLDLTREQQGQLITDHFLFKESDRFLQAANAYNYWPVGRGIFHNKDKTFLVWCNEEDQLRIISMEKGGNVARVLDRLIRGIKAIEKVAGPFLHDDRLGWLTFCPSNLGTTIRASVHICLPKLHKRPEFQEICQKMKLQIRGIHGEHSESEDDIYDVSNKTRLGLTEFEAVKEMYDGIKSLITEEEELEKMQAYLNAYEFFTFEYQSLIS